MAETYSNPELSDLTALTKKGMKRTGKNQSDGGSGEVIKKQCVIEAQGEKQLLSQPTCSPVAK